jgi:hypothetical protein
MYLFEGIWSYSAPISQALKYLELLNEMVIWGIILNALWRMDYQEENEASRKNLKGTVVSAEDKCWGLDLKVRGMNKREKTGFVYNQLEEGRKSQTS